MGTPELAVPSLRALTAAHDVVAVVTQPDRRAGRGRERVHSPVKTCALEHGIDVLQPPSLRDDDVVARLAAFSPDVIVVVAFGQILPVSVLALARLGCVNVHASLLPRHRGASPIQAAILAGDDRTGVTTMLMDEGLDTGPVLLRREVPLQGDETAGSLAGTLAVAGADLLVETLRQLGAGGLEVKPQDAARATMTHRIRKADGAVDWRAPAVAVERHVRAMQPWPGAFTEHGGERLRIWRTKVVAGEGPPGVVLESGERLIVACGSQAVEILEMQRPGGRRMPTADLLRGRPIAVGSGLGAG